MSTLWDLTRLRKNHWRQYFRVDEPECRRTRCLSEPRLRTTGAYPADHELKRGITVTKLSALGRERETEGFVLRPAEILYTLNGTEKSLKISTMAKVIELHLR